MVENKKKEGINEKSKNSLLAFGLGRNKIAILYRLMLKRELSNALNNRGMMYDSPKNKNKTAPI
jgi:hypothetical protein